MEARRYFPIDQEELAKARHSSLIHIRSARVLMENIEPLTDPKHIELYQAIIGGLRTLEQHMLTLNGSDACGEVRFEMVSKMRICCNDSEAVKAGTRKTTYRPPATVVDLAVDALPRSFLLIF